MGSRNCFHLVACCEHVALCLQGCWDQAEEQAGAAGGRRAGTAQGCSGCSCRGPHGLPETRLAAAAALVLAGSLLHLLHAWPKLPLNYAHSTSAYMRIAWASGTAWWAAILQTLQFHECMGIGTQCGTVQVRRRRQARLAVPSGAAAAVLMAAVIFVAQHKRAL